MKKELVADSFVFETSEYVSEPSTKKGVLRTIKGPLAEWDSKNRNTRVYSERLWDKVLDSDYVKEQMDFKTLYGEANHPHDRFEIDFSRVSHSICEMHKVPGKKQIHGTIDILDTPLGNILNVLYEYGSILGMSSRAGGVLRKKKDYIEVDEDTYQFITFDAVPYPSVKQARLVSEGVNLLSEDRMEISGEAHGKLKSIIEGCSQNYKDVLKDFIYSIGYYNLDDEIALLEGFQTDSEDEKERILKDTTLCFLKESYLTSSRLSVENKDLRKELTEVKEEATQCKEELGIASSNLSDITKLYEGLKVENGDLQVRFGVLESQNRNLQDTLSGMEIQSLDRELYESEILALKESIRVLESHVTDNAQKDRTILELREANISLKGQMDALVKESIHAEDLGGDLTQALNELGQALKELEQIREELGLIREENLSLQGNISSLSGEVVGLKQVNESLSTQLKSSNDTLTRVKQELVGAKSITESSARENSVVVSRLIQEKQEVQDSFDTKIREYQQGIDEYRSELLKVVCSRYGVNESQVLGVLDKDYSIGDIYLACESVTKNIGFKVLIEEGKQAPKATSNLDNLFSSSRRAQ